MSPVEQSRHLVTEIPGPASLELTKRRAAAVSAGVGMTMPVFAARAAGGIVEDVDGNRLIDLGSGIAVTTIGSSAPRVVDAVRAQVADFTCFWLGGITGGCCAALVGIEVVKGGVAVAT